MIRKIGDYISRSVQESGINISSTDKYVFACDDTSYFIWERLTGKVVWVGIDGLLGGTGYWIAWDECERLNKRPVDAKPPRT